MENENAHASQASFEAMMGELEGIVQKLEGGNIPLEEMVALYERGADLGKRCMALLDSYQGRIDTLTRQEEEQ